MSLFEKAYFHEYGKKLDPQLMGFLSFKSVLEACPDILNIRVAKEHIFVHPVYLPGG